MSAEGPGVQGTPTLPSSLPCPLPLPCPRKHDTCLSLMGTCPIVTGGLGSSWNSGLTVREDYVLGEEGLPKNLRPSEPQQWKSSIICWAQPPILETTSSDIKESDVRVCGGGGWGIPGSTHTLGFPEFGVRDMVFDKCFLCSFPSCLTSHPYLSLMVATKVLPQLPVCSTGRSLHPQGTQR